MFIIKLIIQQWSLCEVMLKDVRMRRVTTGLPAVGHRDNAGAVLGDLEEHGHGKVEVGARRVAPSPIVIGKSIIWWAKVCSSNENGRAA